MSGLRTDLHHFCIIWYDRISLVVIRTNTILKKRRVRPCDMDHGLYLFKEAIMSLETSKKILKIVGILCVISGIIGIIIGILGFLGGGIIGAGVVNESIEVTEEVGQAMGVGFLLGVVGLISGIVDLLEGIFSINASKDSDKIMPAWIFALIGVVMAGISLIGSFGGEASGIISGIISVALSILVFVAANTIKNSR